MVVGTALAAGVSAWPVPVPVPVARVAAAAPAAAPAERADENFSTTTGSTNDSNR
jgi:hypothetical protein